MGYLETLNEEQRAVACETEGVKVVLAGAGCITGDTEIRFNRCSKGFKTTIKKAFKSFNHKNPLKGNIGWSKEIKTYVRSFKSNVIKLHEIEGIVYSGRKRVYKLILENGLELKATKCHRIMTQDGWVELGKLNKSHYVMCDNMKFKPTSSVIKRSDDVIRSLVFHPYGSKCGEGKTRVELYKMVYEAGINNLELDEYVKILKTDKNKSKKLNFVDPKEFDIHHIDGIPENNYFHNLIAVSKRDHKKFHSNEQGSNFKQGLPDYSKVVSTKYLGFEDTYDIQCKAPFHNFVANGMVIHNSGKTKTVIAKVIHLIQDKKVSPNTIWVCTFTKKAKEELVERLSKEVGTVIAKKVKIGTLHSIAFSIYKNGLTVIDKKSKYGLPKPLVNEGTAIFQLFNFVRANEKKVYNRDGKDFLSTINIRRMCGGNLSNYKKMFPFDMGHRISNGWCYNETVYEAWKFYEKWKRQKNVVDFADMLVLCAEMLENPKYKTYLESLQRSCNYIAIDEAQDNNTVSYRIVNLLSGLNNNITVVGDLRQCQPKGTMVSVTGQEPVDIKDIKVGTTVPSFRRDYSYFSGKNIQGSKITEKKKRKFKGNMYTVLVGDKSTRCTPQHNFYAKWVHTSEEKKNDKRCVVYLMRSRTGKYRIGWCQMFSTNYSNHFFTRCKMEEADGWILKVCNNRQDACYYESLISTNYGIPLTPFISCRTKVGPNAGHHYSQEFLDSIFKEYTNNEIKGVQCLKDYNREPLYPYYDYSRRNEKGKKGKQTIFKIEACNLLPKLMTLPLDSDTRKNFVKTGKQRSRYNAVFTPIDSIEVRYEECFVYSLDVETNHTYIADGIGTCNSIYSFQGSSPQNLHEFIRTRKPRMYDLKINYRSTKTIVDNSNKFIEGSTGIIGAPSVAFKGEGEPIRFCTSEDEISEAQTVHNLIDNLVHNKGYKYSDIAILYRVHSQSVMLESNFLGADVPYVTFTENTFFDKKEIKDIIIYLKAFQNPNSLNFSEFKRIVGRPNRYISSKATKAIESYCKYEGATPWEALNDLGNVGGMDGRNRQCFGEMRNQIISGTNKLQVGTNVKDLIQYILTNIGYETWINEQSNKGKAPDGDITMDFDAIINLVDSFQTLDHFFGYVDKVKEQEAVRKGEKNGNYIQMMTIHACVTGETLVKVNNRTMMIKDAPNTGSVLTPDGIKKYTNKNKRRKSKVINIITKSGYKLNMTVDHGVNVFSKEGVNRVNARDIIKGDIVRLKLGCKDTTKYIKLSTHIINTPKQAKRYRTPKYLNDDLAEFLGLFVADGTLFKNGYRLVKRYKSTADRFAYLSNRLFGTVHKTEELDRGGMLHYQVTVSSTYISQWLSQFEFIKPNNKSVPLEIVNSPRSVKCAFLKGFAEDGSVVEKDSKLDHIRFNSVSYSAIFNTQYVLREMGLVSTIKTYKQQKSKNDMHVLYISGIDARKYADEVGAVAKERQDIIDRTETTTLDRRIVPITNAEFDLIGNNFPNASSKRNAKTRGYVGRTTYRKITSKLKGKFKKVMLEKLNWHYDRIDSFEIGKEETYCLTVPDGGRFLQNGFDAFNSKGKEFPVVITLGNCTRLAPFWRNADREEEKRLMYVAVTRPEKELYVSVIGKKLGRFKVYPSPFLCSFGAVYNEDYSGKFESFN